jgi:cysteinyl-tRNA synthetase
MTLKIYNTLTRKKEPFEPLTPGKVRMYVCGITAYDECHLGHARAAVVFDAIYRYLKYKGYDVIYIRNFTDIDDKIIKKSQETGLPWNEITEKYIGSYREQMKQLGVENPTEEPRATEHIPQMIELIQKLIQKGLAYRSGKDVFYRVRKFSSYGKLAHKKIDELESGARIEVDEKKEDPLDFALWKGAKPNEPEWDSPWGKGRPGWHIECSAMSMKYLGESFDIHGGGRDLMFPHHENEIAQSEGATGQEPFAKFWIHNGFVNINAEKMSKSLGNIRTIPAILDQWDPEVVRYFLLSAHYASPLDFTDEAMTNAREALNRFYESLQRFLDLPEGDEKPPIGELFDGSILASLDDDFNTPALIGRLFEVIRLINKSQKPSRASKEAVRAAVEKIGSVLGIFANPSDYLERQKRSGLKSATVTEAEILKLLDERKAARQAKDFQRADQIRKNLAAQGVQIKDNPDGSASWEIKR